MVCRLKQTPPVVPIFSAHVVVRARVRTHRRLAPGARGVRSENFSPGQSSWCRRPPPSCCPRPRTREPPVDLLCWKGRKILQTHRRIQFCTGSTVVGPDGCRTTISLNLPRLVYIGRVQLRREFSILLPLLQLLGMGLPPVSSHTLSSRYFPPQRRRCWFFFLHIIGGDAYTNSEDRLSLSPPFGGDFSVVGPDGFRMAIPCPLLCLRPVRSNAGFHVQKSTKHTNKSRRARTPGAPAASTPSPSCSPPCSPTSSSPGIRRNGEIPPPPSSRNGGIRRNGEIRRRAPVAVSRQGRAQRRDPTKGGHSACTKFEDTIPTTHLEPSVHILETGLRGGGRLFARPKRADFLNFDADTTP